MPAISIAVTEPTLWDLVRARLSDRKLWRAVMIFSGLAVIVWGEIVFATTPHSLLDRIVVLLVSILVVLLGLRLRPAAGPVTTEVVTTGWDAGQRVTPEAEAASPSAFSASLALDLLRTVRFPAALLLAFWAEYLLFFHPELKVRAIVLWIAVIGLSLPNLARWEGLGVLQVLQGTKARPLNRGLLIWGLVLAAFAYFAAGSEQYTPGVVIPWGLSVVFWIAGLLGVQPRAPDWRGWLGRALTWLKRDAHGFTLSRTALLFLGILAIGVFLRFYQLDSVPREMTSDHVEKLLDVNDILQGQHPIFFPRNTGREPLQFYYTAGLIRLFDWPLAHFNLKFGTALAGSVTLIFVFLLARELGGSELGLWAMLLAAIARWPVALSRAALRYPFAPLLVAPVFYFLVRGLKSGRRSDFVWAGVFLGAGLHGYSAFRVVPLAVLFIAGLWLLQRSRAGPHRVQLAGNVLSLYSTALIIFVPLLRYMMDRPDLFWYRMLTRIGPVEQQLPGNPFAILWKNIYRVLLMFNYTGDVVWTVNISGRPALSYVMAGLFGLGTAFVLYRAAVRRDLWAITVFCSFGLMLLPSALSLAYPDENPSVVRASAAMPFVFLILAIPLPILRRELGWRRSKVSNSAAPVSVLGDSTRAEDGAPSLRAPVSVLGDSTRAGDGAPSLSRAGDGASILTLSGGLIAGVIPFLAAVLILLFAARLDVYDYFKVFREQYALSATNPSEVGAVVKAYLAGGGELRDVWLKGYPHWLDLRAVAIESGDITWGNAVLESSQLASTVEPGRPRLYIVHYWDREALDLLHTLYPQGVVAFHDSPTPTKGFLTFFVPGAQTFDEGSLPPPP